MKNRNIDIIITAMITLISTVISDAIPNPVLRIIFICCFMTGIISFLIYSEHNDKKKIIFPGICGAVALVILFTSALQEKGTINDYATHVKNFFLNEKDEQDINQTYYQTLSSINKNITNLAVRADNAGVYIPEIDKMNDEILKLSSDIDTYRLCEKKEDQKQIANILAEIQKEEDFPELMFNKKQIELFYKMRITEEPYYYINIIKAFEAYGIDCENWGIDEYTLVLWDTEHLFALYNMRKDLENEMEEDTFYEEWKAYYNDYKAVTPEYRDNFDYMDWNYSITKKNVSEIMEKLNDRIMKCYVKLNMNFRDTIE